MLLFTMFACILFPTGFSFQIIFQKHLSRIQWMSLVFLTGGCIVKEYGRLSLKAAEEKVEDDQTTEEGSFFDLHLVLILVQVDR